MTRSSSASTPLKNRAKFSNNYYANNFYNDLNALQKFKDNFFTNQDVQFEQKFQKLLLKDLILDVAQRNPDLQYLLQYHNRVQQIVISSNMFQIMRHNIRFKLLQRLIDSKNTRADPQFEQWEIQLLNQLNSIYQGELQIRIIQERVLLTNEKYQSSLEKFHFGLSLPIIKQPTFQVKFRQRKENRKKKWLQKMTEKKKFKNFQ